MKKVLSVMLMFILLLSLMIPAYADSEAKEVEVVVSASAMKVMVNEIVELSAVVSKHGSSFTDSWSLAEKGTTTLAEDSESYVSTAAFKAEKPGKYIIEYDITMSAGKSNVIFIGKGTVTVEVIEEIKEIIGAKIEITSLVEQKTNNGVTYYRAEGTKYAIWSNAQDSKSYGYIAINFSVNDVYKDIEVKIENYGYRVRVKREVGVFSSIQ